jgi:phosphate-selective porin OprO and OprP
MVAWLHVESFNACDACVDSGKEGAVKRIVVSVSVGMAVLLGLWTPAVYAGEAKEKPVIEQILDLLLQRGQITPEEYRSLQEKARQEQVAGVKASESAVLAGIEKGKPFLKSADDNFRIEFGGRLQADFDAAEGGTRTLEGSKLGSQFLVRRARLDVDGSLYRWIGFRIEAEFTEGVSLKDAYLDLRFFPEARLRVGQLKVPFSLEELTSDNYIDFVERSLVNELAPSRDRGVMVYGDLLGGAVGYSLGGFNGTGEDTSDDNSDKDLAARLAFAPFRTSDSFWLKGLQFAGNITWGNQDGSSSAQGRTSARTINRFRFFAPQDTRGDRLRYGGDLAWLIGPAALKFEYDVQTDERQGQGPGGSNLDDVTATGWYVSGTYVLTGEDKLRSGNVVPRYPFIPLPGKMGPGAWEVGVRYAELDFDSDDPVNFFDSDLADIPGGGQTGTNGAQALTLGLNWYMTEQVRFMFNWTQYWFDNSLGTPFSCPTSSCTAASLRAADDSAWEILSRLQVWF